MRHWTPDEDAYLIENFIAMQAWEIGENLDRSPKAVNNRAQLLRSKGLLTQTIAYLPGQLRVPCVHCGTEFDRPKGPGKHQKYCSSECVRLSKWISDPNYDYTLCSKCRTNPKPVRGDGSLRGWCKPCEAADKYAYNHSQAAKESLKRYRATEKGKATQARARKNWRDKQRTSKNLELDLTKHPR